MVGVRVWVGLWLTMYGTRMLCLTGAVQVFGEVVSDVEVEIGANVRHKELALSNAVANPMKAHFDGFGASLLDEIVGDTDGASVAAHQHSRWLRMTNVGKDSAETGGMLGAREQCGVFSFSGAGNDARDDCREGVDGAIDFKWLMVISEEKVTASDGTGVRARKVGSVDVAMKDHVAGVISDRVVGVGSGIR